MFSHGFPYTNFHDLNLDWIIKTVKMLFNKSVFSINNVEPDDEGNVTISGAELGAVGTVNNIAPVDGNVTITASDVGAIAVGQGVTKVNGFGPDAQGNVTAGTIRMINGISPTSLPTPGSITLTASDVGALPSSIDPVETVNGISPDAQGNVNVGTVKSVNGSTPDAQGNVNLPTVAGVTSVNGIGPDAQGNVNVGTVKSVNGSSPDAQGNVTLVAPVTSVNAFTGAVSLVQDIPSTVTTLNELISHVMAHPNILYVYNNWSNPGYAPVNGDGYWHIEAFCGVTNDRFPIISARRYNATYMEMWECGAQGGENGWIGNWIEVYNNIRTWNDNFLTANSGVVIDSQAVDIYNGIKYYRISFHTTIAQTGNAVLFTNAVPPKFTAWSQCVDRTNNKLVTIAFEPNGNVNLTYLGDIESGAYCTITLSAP